MCSSGSPASAAISRPREQRHILERGPPKDDEDGAMLVGCWAHCRMYFFEAAICRYPVGLQGLLRILAIYAADQAARRALLAGPRPRPMTKHRRDQCQSVETAASSAGLSKPPSGPDHVLSTTRDRARPSGWTSNEYASTRSFRAPRLTTSNLDPSVRTCTIPYVVRSRA